MTGRHEENGRIKVSLRDIVGWAVLFATILGAWYDSRTQMALTRQALELRIKADDREHESLRQEDQRIWGAVREVQASERPRPRR